MTYYGNTDNADFHLIIFPLQVDVKFKFLLSKPIISSFFENSENGINSKLSFVEFCKVVKNHTCQSSA